MKNKVIFDTSFLSRSKEGIVNANKINIIDAEFPISGWDRFINDYVIDEIFPGNLKSQPHHAQTSEYYKNNQLKMMQSSHYILIEEFKNGTITLKEEKNHEQQLQAYLEGTHPNQYQIEAAHDSQRTARTKAKQEIIDQTQKNHSTTSISLSGLQSELEQLITDGYQCSLHGGYVIYIKGKSYELINCYETPAITKEITDLETELPTLYMFLIAELLLKNVSQGKIILPGLTKKVEIELNTISDFQISLSGLHYCDAFATFDKGQAGLIKFLFSKYENKLKVFEKSQNGDYVAINLSSL